MSQKVIITPEAFEYMEKVTGTDGVEVRVNLPKEIIEQINEICDSFDNDPGELINVLHEAQNRFGYLPAEVQDMVAHNLHIPVAQVYGVVTFYSYFSMIPKGEHPISICVGTACYVRGAERVLEEFIKELGIKVGETTPDGRFSINCLRCVGACGLAPVVLVGDKVYGRVSPDGVKQIIAEYSS
jgi:NADH-quinone oxidoreductase subunit E/NADP-reducing hydrogenase subunit HndA